jgi:hypothetical protein
LVKVPETFARAPRFNMDHLSKFWGASMSDEFCKAHLVRDGNAVASGGATPALLHREAARCRRLANTVGDRWTMEALRSMAADYDAQARRNEPEAD